MKKVVSFITSCLLCVVVFAQPIDKNVHTVLFLGNSITYAGSYITNVEAWYATWHPAQKIDFINMGLPSETVSGLSEEGHAGGRFPRPDLHERLHRVLKVVKADIVFVSYGMNDGIYQPLDEYRFKRYQLGMQWLHDTLVATGARVIVLTPPVYDDARGEAKGYGRVLDIYSEWLLKQRQAKKWEVADIHFPMKRYLEKQRRQDSSFALANDGVHPAAIGHWIMAQQILLHLGQKEASKYDSIQVAVQIHKNGEAILALLAERQTFMKDAWLTATGHTRPEMKTGLPLQEAREKATAIGHQLTALQQVNGHVNIK